MPIDLDDHDYITWTADVLDNLDQKTVILRIIFDAFHASGFPNHLVNKANEWTTSGWMFQYYGHTDDHILRYLHEWTVRGVWEVDIQLNTGTLYHLAVSYDRTNVNNDPNIYIDGELKVEGETLTPAGAVEDDSGYNFHVGLVNESVDGPMSCLLIYDRILSDAEILEHYNSKQFITNLDGLVFFCPMMGASGLQTFEGATLSSSNKIVDEINGLKGTPTGDPVGVGETVLSY